MVAYKRGADVRLIRTGRDHTKRFADIARAIGKLSPRTLILDGEVAVFDERLVSRFDLLGDSSPPELVTPPIFMAFDCLYREGRDLRPLPLGERRALLERVVAGDLVLAVRRLPTRSDEAWAEVQRRGYEGMVAKDDGATYRGGRSRAWLKVKVRYEGVFVVGGVGLGDAVRGLLVGERDSDRLLFRGTVEFGVSSGVLAELAASPLARPTSPFADLPRRRGVTWLEPTVAVEVQYNEMTGGRLRAPVLRAFTEHADLAG